MVGLGQCTTALGMIPQLAFGRRLWSAAIHESMNRRWSCVGNVNMFGAPPVLAFATMALRLEPRLSLSHIAHLSTIASTLERHGCSSLSGSLAGPKDRRKLERNVPLIHIRYVLLRHLLGKYRPTAGDSEMAPQDVGIVQNRLGNGAPPCACFSEMGLAVGNEVWRGSAAPRQRPPAGQCARMRRGPSCRFVVSIL
jgi:hypothetical protein